MSDSYYKLVYDITKELSTEISYVGMIFFIILGIFGVLILFPSVNESKLNKVGKIAFILLIIYIFIYKSIIEELDYREENQRIINQVENKRYIIVEGKIESYKPSDYRGRKGGEFILNGYKYKSSYKGFIEDDFEEKLKNGLQIKIASKYYPNDYRSAHIYKVWIEDSRYEECIKDKKDDTCFKLALENVKDKEKFNMFFEKSLNSDNALTLFHIGQLYEVGAYRESNNTKALEFYKKSCNRGEKKACDAYGALLEK